MGHSFWLLNTHAHIGFCPTPTAAEDEEQQEAEAEPAAKPAAKWRKSEAKAGGAGDAEDGPLVLPAQLNKSLTGAPDGVGGDALCSCLLTAGC